MKKLSILFVVFISFSAEAQFSREQAIDILIEEVVGQDSLSFHHFFSKIEMLEIGDTLWGDGFFSFQICPYSQNWVFFVDDAPLANWAHPCRYIFFDIQNGAYTIISDNWPPLHYLDEPELFFAEWDWILGTAAATHNNFNQQFLVYPNPVQKELYITPTNPTLKGNKEGCQLTLSDLKGNQVLIQKVSEPDNEFTLDLTNINQGIYLLCITQNGKRIYSQKILKQ